MAVNAYDVQLCLWKMLKLSSKTCVTISINHPYVSSTLLCLLFLYICFPLVFWILIYSLPLVVCTCILLIISFGLRNEKKYREERERENSENCSKTTNFAAAAADDCGDDDKSKKPYSRVHSVRRRRAREIMMREEDAPQNVEEKNAVSSTDFNTDMVDKNALIEETSPKEIREVEVDYPLAHTAKENDEGANQNGRSELMREKEEPNKAVQENHEDDQKNVVEVGISDAERSKRLESLIARRRSRKLLSLQIRRSLMNIDRNDHSNGPISSVAIPKINTNSSPSKVGAPFSPGPGSAPSILIPMRNPFDLPYDPQEEKPDLTGDSFQQEFASVSNRDLMFCRHESFSLGPSLPGKLFKDREETSSVHDFGFRQRGFSTGSRFSRPGNESERKFDPILEHESHEVSESKSNEDSPDEDDDDDDDQIKEIIQVYENGTRNHSEESTDEVETRRIQRGDFSSTSSSRSSSEEGEPVFKIDREAILKSLSSMQRNTFQEIDENNEMRENLSYANSALENASRLKQQYYADKPMKRHATSYSIASDMQVEVSEISSPPLTIDENMSYLDENVSTYDGEMERNISWDGEELWAASSRVSEVDDNESRSTQVSENEHQIEENATIESNADAEQFAAERMRPSEEMVEESRIVDDHENVEPVQHIEGEEQSFGEAMDSSDLQEQSLMPNVAQSSMISPKSVLLPTFSVSSFDPYIDEDVQQHRAHAAEFPSPVAIENSTSLTEQSTDLPSNASTIEGDNVNSVNEKMTIQENDEQSKEVATNSSEILGIHEEGTSSRSFINIDEVCSNDFEAANRNVFSENIDQTDGSIPSLSTAEEMVIGESTHNDSTKSGSCEDERENSALHEETGKEANLDEEMQENIDSTIENESK